MKVLTIDVDKRCKEESCVGCCYIVTWVTFQSPKDKSFQDISWMHVEIPWVICYHILIIKLCKGMVNKVYSDYIGHKPLH